ncbi:MAG: hypothetical protein M1823_002686 [Watsoniomyces obsoletus]|nr:MAG: hypothetical protein M1823_002686 [Watsoniomyces obsoletus]
MSSAAEIYEGVWIDWSKGRVRGVTLTIDSNNAVFLTAFLALFIQFVGSSWWAVLAFAVHQFKASKHPQDGLYHQHQVVFRNAPAGTALTLLLQSGRAWRNIVKRPLLRSLPWALFAALHIASWQAAAIMSARIGAQDGDVLLRSPHCGDWNNAREDLPSYDRTAADSLLAYWRHNRQLSLLSSTYASSCYNASTEQSHCKTLSGKPVNWTTTYDVACPFTPGMCDRPALQMDTGPIDSHEHLGINARESDRVTYHRITTCAPVTKKGFESEWQNATEPDYPGQRHRDLYYGTLGPRNFTHRIYNTSDIEQALGYNVDLMSFLANDTRANSSVAISNISRTDADVTLAFLIFNGIYLDPVTDPWFRANVSIESDWTPTLYKREREATVLGCVEQHQFCQPASSKTPGCTARMGYWQLQQALEYNTLGGQFNPRQMAVVRRLVNSVYDSTVFRFIMQLNAGILKVGRATVGIVSAQPSDDQWMIEVQWWQAIAMSSMQLRAVDWASGPEDPASRQFVQFPTTPEGREMCNNQKVRKSTHTSFSVLGIGIVFGLGLFIVFLGTFIHSIVDRIQRWTHRGTYRGLDWAWNGMLQLQRLGFEGRNIGTWSEKDDVVPTTAAGEKFRPLFATNPELELDDGPLAQKILREDSGLSQAPTL